MILDDYQAAIFILQQNFYSKKECKKKNNLTFDRLVLQFFFYCPIVLIIWCLIFSYWMKYPLVGDSQSLYGILATTYGSGDL